ncbi:MAG: TraM recognition domain-containing protein [Planctomycetota bacterium]
MVCTFVKLEFQREILRRPNKTRRSFFFCDEFQSFFTIQQGKGDADFFERTRQSKHANIIATQNLPALLKVSPQDKNQVLNLLGNCAVKIFLRNTDDETNQFASKLFGQKIVTLGSANFGGGGGGGGGMLGGMRPTAGGYSGNAQYDACVRPEEFARLAIPSQTAGIGHADAIVHLGSRAEVERKKLRWVVHPLGSGPAPDVAAASAVASTSLRSV